MKNGIRYGGFAIGVLLTVAYSTTGAPAAGDQCNVGATCNNGVSTCTAVVFQGNDNNDPCNYYCACGTQASTDCCLGPCTGGGGTCEN